VVFLTLLGQIGFTLGNLRFPFLFVLSAPRRGQCRVSASAQSAGVEPVQETGLRRRCLGGRWRITGVVGRRRRASGTGQSGA
jgi:hypothetical protein